MATDFKFRKLAVESLPRSMGVYVLCDLDNIPIYVGRSSDVGERVRRHTTSARSDIIANRQIDVWEIAYVWIYPLTDSHEAKLLEARLIHRFNASSQLFNGALPKQPIESAIPEPVQMVQVMSDAEIAEKKDEVQRLPRQAAHYAQIVGHFLAVKNSTHVKRAMNAHFERLKKYHATLLGIAEEDDK